MNLVLNEDDIKDAIAEVVSQFGCDETDLRITEIDRTEFILSMVPEEFRSRLSYMAYERGHSAGETECELILASLVGDLLPCITAFQKRLEGSK